MSVICNKTFIKRLLREEPWRSSPGEVMCSDAELDWDGSSSWLCKTCGRIGHHQFTIHTKPMSNLDATKDVQG